MNTRTLWIVGSALAHGALVLAAGRLGAARPAQKERLVFVEAARKSPPNQPPPPSEAPAPEPPAVVPKTSHVRHREQQPAPKVAEIKPTPEAAHDAPAEPLDLGLALEGGGSGSGGLAVAVGVGAGRERATAPSAGAAATPPREKILASSRGAVAACTESPRKPVAKSRKLPKYSEAARAARIEGKVSVKVTVDIEGRVVAATVVAGLGYGLDEEAVAAARSWTFEPSTACGKAVPGSTVLGMRFVLQD